MIKGNRFLTFLTIILLSISAAFAQAGNGMISGKVLSLDGDPLDFATVMLKGTKYTSTTNDKGLYHISAPAGQYTLVVSSVGFEKKEISVKIEPKQRRRINVKLNSNTHLADLIVVANPVSKVRNSAFNATAVNTQDLVNTTKTLSEALSKAPGMKIRESGGVGSDMAVTMDGFSGKHVKVFIDGVPQEGVGSSFGLNNIPVNFADRIEVYRGVVPVGFGTDAIGGVINIVTPKRQRRWFVDASYSYGSFNTHKSYVNFGQTFDSGFKYEINAFQNYSDNDYSVDAPVENFETGAVNHRKLYRVKRFNDTYHNEAIVGKLGFVNKTWADRLLVGFTWSHMYKEVQTGVRQEIVYGQKHRHGHSLMPSLEYAKRNLFTKGLDVSLTANYNHDTSINVDTASVRYNWFGQTIPTTGGEQSLQNTKSLNHNWSATATVNYQLGNRHVFTINNVFNIVFIALGDSVAIIVGQLLGAGKMKEARDTDNKMIAFSVFSCTCMALVMLLLARFFPLLFKTNEEARLLATYFIMVAAIFMPQNAFLHASYFTLRSGGKTIVTFLFDSVFIWCVSVTIAFTLSRYTALPVVAVFTFVQAGDLIKCVIGFILVKKGVWLQNIVE